MILGGLPFEHDTVAQAVVFDVAGVRVKLPRVEHLLIMKAIANRPQDQQDVAGLLDAHPDVDAELVRSWVGEFARAMSMSGLVDDFERALAQRRL